MGPAYFIRLILEVDPASARCLVASERPKPMAHRHLVQDVMLVARVKIKISSWLPAQYPMFLCASLVGVRLRLFSNGACCLCGV